MIRSGAKLRSKVPVAILAIMSLLVHLFPVAVFAARHEQKGASSVSEVIVFYKDAAAAVSAAASISAKGLTRARNPHGNIELLRLPEKAALAEVIAQLRADPNVIHAEPNYQVFPQALPTDPLVGEQWGLSAVFAPEAWEQAAARLAAESRTAAEVIVAVLDTGVDTTHPDLTGRVTAGHNVITGTGDVTDLNGHGTGVAGVLAATINNAEGVAGYAGSLPVRVMPVKVLGDDGVGTIYDVAMGIRWAAENGATVINASLGAYMPDYPLILAEAVDYAWSLGAVVVAAAGNMGADVQDFYPAALPSVVSVAALDRNLRPAAFSNLNTTTAAPGVDMAVPQAGGGYTAMSGTSLAAPVVAAGAAVIRSTYPDLAAGELRNALSQGACSAWGDSCPAFNMQQALTDALGVYPSLEIEEPAHGQIVSGTFTIRARITAQAASVTEVVYGIQPEYSEIPVVWEDLAPPPTGLYTYEVDSATVPDGEAEIEVTARDQYGSIVASDWVRVRVQNQRSSGIAVQVVKPDGTPAARARVTIAHDPHESTTLVADESGRVIFPAAEFPDGNDYHIIAYGSSPYFLYHTVVRGPASVTLDATGATHVQLSGRTMEGAPLSGAVVTANLLQQDPDRPNYYYSLTSEMVGWLSAEGRDEAWLSPGTYGLDLISTTDNYVLDTWQDIAGETAAVNFHPAPGQLAALSVASEEAYEAVALVLSWSAWSIPYGLRLMDASRPIMVSPGYQWPSLMALRPDPTTGERFSMRLDLGSLRLNPGEERTLPFGGDLIVSVEPPAATVLGPGEQVTISGAVTDAYGNALEQLSRAGAASTRTASDVIRLTATREAESAPGMEVYDPAAGGFVPAWTQSIDADPQLVITDGSGQSIYTTVCYNYGSFNCRWSVPATLASGTYTATVTMEAGPFGGPITSDPITLTVGTPDGKQVQVLDRSGLPMAGARVHLLRRGTVAYEVWSTVTTDANGNAIMPYQLKSAERYLLAVQGATTLPGQGSVQEHAVALIPLADGATAYPPLVSLANLSMERVALQALPRDQTQAVAFEFSLLNRAADGYPLSLVLEPAAQQNSLPLWVTHGTHLFRAGSASENEVYDLRTGWTAVAGPLPDGGSITLGGPDTARLTIAAPATPEYWVEGIALFAGDLRLAPMARRGYWDTAPVLYATPGTYFMQTVLAHDAPDGMWDYWLARELTLLPGEDRVHEVDAAFSATLSLNAATYAAGSQLQSTHELSDGKGNRLVWLGNNLSQFPPEWLSPWVWYATGGAPVLFGPGAGELTAQNHEDRAPFLVIQDQGGSEVVRYKYGGENNLGAWCQGDQGCHDWLRENPSTFFGAEITLPQELYGGLYTAILEFHASYDGAILSQPLPFEGIGGLAPPHLNPPQSPTRADQIEVTGSTRAGAAVALYRSLNGGAAELAAQATAGTDGSFTATVTLPGEGTYQLTAKASYDGQESSLSAAVAVVVDRTAPAQPAGLEWESPDHAHIRLRWTPSAESDLAQYRIWRDGEQIATLPGNTAPGATGKVEFLDSGLTGETDYVYAVEAVDQAGNLSPQAAATTRTSKVVDTTAPAAPTNLRAEAAEGGKVTLTWDAATDNIAVAKYIVTRAAGNTGTSFEVTQGTSYTDEGLPADTVFTYTVTAVDAAGNESEPAGPVAVQTLVMRLDSFAWQGERTPGRLIRPGSTVAMSLLGERGRTASALVAYRQWVNGVLTDREESVALSEVAASPGTYRGSFTVGAGVAEIRSITGRLSDGVSPALTRAGQSLPVEVAGRLAVTLAHPQVVTLAGGRLQVWSASKSAGGQATLGQTGSLLIPDLPPADDYSFRLLDSRGLELTSGTTGPVRGGLDTAITITPPAPATLRVQAVNQQGVPVPGVTVRAENAATGSYLAQAGTDADGLIPSITGLTEGQQVRVQVRSHLPYPLETTAVVTLGPGDNRARVELAPMPRGRLTGAVLRFDGEPAAGVNVTLTQWVSQHQVTLQAVTDAAGRYSLEPYAGTARLAVSGGQPPVRLTGSDSVSVTVPSGAHVTQDLTVTDLQRGEVSMDLRTQAFGSNLWTEWSEDGSLANRFRFTVTDSVGKVRYAWGAWGAYEYPIQVVYRPGDILNACVDGEREGFGRQCVPVVMDGAQGVASFAIQDQRVKVTGSLLSPTEEAVTSWNAAVTGPDGFYQSIRSQESNRFMITLPKPGTYQIRLSAQGQTAMGVTREITITPEQMSGSVDLGPIYLTAAPTFGERAANRLLVSPGAQLPGAVMGLRASWGYAAGAIQASDATLLLDLPAGSSLVAGSLTGDAALDQSRVVDGTYMLPLGALAPGDSGVARYQIQLSEGLRAGTILTASMRVRFTVNGVESEEQLDTAVIQVDGVTMNTPEQVTEPSVFLTGRAPAGFTVQIRDGDLLIGETLAGATGYWQIRANLADLGDPSRHLLRAEATPPDGSSGQTALRSPARAVLYDSLSATLLTIGLSSSPWKSYTFPVAEGPVAFPFTVTPYDVLKVTATFDNPDGVTNVRIYIGGTGLDATRAGNHYEASFDNIQSFGDVRVTFDPKPRSYAQTPKPTQEQLLALLPPEWKVIEPRVVGEEVLAGTLLTLPKLLLFPDPANPEKILEISWTLEGVESYTPSAEELARVEAGDAPVFGLDTAVDGAGMVLTGYMQTVELGDLYGIEGPRWTKFTALAKYGDLASVALDWYDQNQRIDSFLEEVRNNPNIIDKEPWESSAQSIKSSGEIGIMVRTVMLGSVLILGGTLSAPVTGAIMVLYAATEFAMGGIFDRLFGYMQSQYDRVCGCYRRGFFIKPFWIYDPSGYVYEAVPDNRLEGVQATAQYKEGGIWVTWDATWFEQVNPQRTDLEGRYGWDVPPGLWRVVYEKDGYARAYSGEMVVPPPRTEVNAGLTSLVPPQVTGASVHHPAGEDPYIALEFSQYMGASTLSAHTLFLQTEAAEGEEPVTVGLTAQPVNGTLVDGQSLSRSFRLLPAAPLGTGAAYRLTLTPAVQNYAGTFLAQEYSVRLVVPADGQEPPVITPGSPANGALVSTARPVITATVTSAPGIDRIELQIDGAPVAAQHNATSGAVTYTPAADLTQGAHTAVLTAFDTAGGQAEAAWSFTIDSVPPQLSVTVSPAAANPGSSVGITVTSQEALKAAPVVRVSRSGAADEILLLTSAGYLQWTAQFRVPSLQATTIFTITAQGSDLAGNAGSSSASLHGRLPGGGSLPPDTVPPQLGVVTPADGAYVRELRPAITVAAGDATQATIAVDGTDVTAKALLNAGSLSYTPAQDLAQGLHTVSVTAADAAGNKATHTWKFTVDTIPPVLRLRLSPEKATPQGLVEVTVESAEALTGVPEVTVAGKSVTLSPAGQHRWTGSFTASSEAGLQTVQATAVDLAGNRGQLSLSLQVEVPLPVELEDPDLLQGTTGQGEMRLEGFDGGFVMLMPPGSLPEGSRITVRRLPMPSGRPQDSLRPFSSGFELTTGEALREGSLVKVTLGYDRSLLKGIDARRLGIYRRDDKSPLGWTYAGGTVNPVAGTVSTYLRGFSEYAVFAWTPGFQDMLEHWSRPEVEVLASRHLVNGMAPGIFQPDRSITRAELAKMLVLMLAADPTRGIQVVGSEKPTFADVAPAAWYYGYVETAYRLGLIRGSEGRFRPDDPVTRQEMSVMIVRALGLEQEARAAARASLSFADEGQVADWARGYVAVAVQKELLRGMTPTAFVPGGQATRAQASVIMVRAMDLEGLLTER